MTTQKPPARRAAIAAIHRLARGQPAHRILPLTQPHTQLTTRIAQAATLPDLLNQLHQLDQLLTERPIPDRLPPTGYTYTALAHHLIRYAWLITQLAGFHPLARRTATLAALSAELDGDADREP